MKTRPILFSEPMVRAILNGSKTQTRRVCKPAENLSYVIPVSDPKATVQQPPYLTPGWFGDEEGDVAFKSPYGVPGDQLWVRETWQYYDWDEDGRPCIRFAADNQTAWPDYPESAGESLNDIWCELSEPSNYNIDNRARDRKWRPSIFMPRWASRITLEITGVRVERLNDISEADALAEGIQKLPVLRSAYCQVDGGMPIAGTPVTAYRNLWGSINGKGSWDVNPWVWVIEFKRVAA